MPRSTSDPDLLTETQTKHMTEDPEYEKVRPSKNTKITIWKEKCFKFSFLYFQVAKLLADMRIHDAMEALKKIGNTASRSGCCDDSANRYNFDGQTNTSEFMFQYYIIQECITF